MDEGRRSSARRGVHVTATPPYCPRPRGDPLLTARGDTWHPLSPAVVVRVRYSAWRNAAAPPYYHHDQQIGPPSPSFAPHAALPMGARAGGPRHNEAYSDYGRQRELDRMAGAAAWDATEDLNERMRRGIGLQQAASPSIWHGTARDGPIPPRVLATFEHFDRNRSGFLDYRELREALRHYGLDMSMSQAANLVQRYDSNPDGRLDVGEFAALIRDLEQSTHHHHQGHGHGGYGYDPHAAPARPGIYSGAGLGGGGAPLADAYAGPVPPRVLATFEHFDRNRSGFLDYRELREALRHYGLDMSMSQAANLVQRYDSNPDGRLDVNEFAAMVRDLEAAVNPPATREYAVGASLMAAEANAAAAAAELARARNELAFREMR